MQSIIELNDVKLDENNERFTSGTLKVEFTVSHSQDAKDRAKDNGYDGEGEETAVDVPHTAVIDISGAKVEEVLHYASKPRIISLQNKLKDSYDTEDAFDRAVRNGQTSITLVPERSRKKDPKEKLSTILAGLSPEEKADFATAMQEDRVDEWIEDYYAE